MGDGVGVPAFGQHRHRDHAADLLAEPAGAADGVHHLAQQLALAGLALHAAGAFARGELALELLDLRAGRVAEALVQRIAGFDLARVDQQRPRTGKARALVVIVAEQLEMPGMEGRAFAFLRIAALEAGDPFEHQLGDRRVLAHDDEHRRHADAGALPALELALVMAVERVQRRPQHVGQIERAELVGAGRGLRQILADMLPQVAIDDRIGLHEIVGDRHARQLDDAALDRVHQAEIGHDPGEQSPRDNPSRAGRRGWRTGRRPRARNIGIASALMNASSSDCDRLSGWRPNGPALTDSNALSCASASMRRMP